MPKYTIPAATEMPSLSTPDTTPEPVGATPPPDTTDTITSPDNTPDPLATSPGHYTTSPEEHIPSDTKISPSDDVTRDLPILSSDPTLVIEEKIVSKVEQFNFSSVDDYKGVDSEDEVVELDTIKINPIVFDNTPTSSSGYDTLNSGIVVENDIVADAEDRIIINESYNNNENSVVKGDINDIVSEFDTALDTETKSCDSEVLENSGLVIEAHSSYVLLDEQKEGKINESDNVYVDIENEQAEQVVENELSEQVVENELSEHVVENELSEQVVENELSEQVVENEQAEQVVENELSEQVVENELTEQVVENELSEHVVENELSEQVVENEQAEQVVENEQAEQVVENELSEQVVENEQAEQVVDNEQAEQVVDNELSEQVVENELSEQVVDNEQAEQVVEKGDSKYDLVESKNVPETELDDTDGVGEETDETAEKSKLDNAESEVAEVPEIMQVKEVQRDVQPEFVDDHVLGNDSQQNSLVEELVSSEETNEGSGAGAGAAGAALALIEIAEEEIAEEVIADEIGESAEDKTSLTSRNSLDFANKHDDKDLEKVCLLDLLKSYTRITLYFI